MSELSQAPLPVPGVDVPVRLCPKCGKPMDVIRKKIPEGTNQKGWAWKCKPCSNAKARELHATPKYQASKQAYRELHAEKIAARKSEWFREDRVKDPAKYQAQARRSHQQLMADPERKRAKYDKANERDRKDLIELKKDPEAYAAHLKAERKRNYLRFRRNRYRILDQGKESHYRRKYGITLEQLSALYKEQGEKCACCGVQLPNPATTKTKHGRGQWHLDHDHETGEIRGVLCHRCNMGLGMFKDDTLRLQKAIRYLNGSNRDLVSAVLHGSDEGAEHGGIPDAGSDAAVGLSAERA